jgi:hypothetical protein
MPGSMGPDVSVCAKLVSAKTTGSTNKNFFMRLLFHFKDKRAG